MMVSNWRNVSPPVGAAMDATGGVWNESKVAVAGADWVKLSWTTAVTCAVPLPVTPTWSGSNEHRNFAFPSPR